MTPLLPHPLALGDAVELRWSGAPPTVTGHVRRLGHRLFGPVVDLTVDDASVAVLGCGALIRVAPSGATSDFPARVLHVETRWRTFGDRVVRAPSVLTMMTSSLEEAMRPRRFVRVDCSVPARALIAGAMREGECSMLSPRGMVVRFAGPLPVMGELVLTLDLPTGTVEAHAWVVTRDIEPDGTHRLGVSFTGEQRIGSAVQAFVVAQGYTPVPASLAG